MAIDIMRRKSVMARSIKLGHCVCNPKQPCPCPTFKEHNVCTCAGERLPVRKGSIPLTKYVKKAGCASKIGQADLHQILSKLPEIKDSRVLLGAAAGDDAGIFRLDDQFSLVQTVDVFSPCVDDPYLFGQIAAANSVSDVYAMGGKPLTALSVVGFPIEELDGGIMEAMLRGGIEKMNEADCPVIGGHSINDEEIKCGFAVTGLIASDRVVARDRAEPGDVLVLTKPLGTGMVSFAAQIGRISPEALDEAGVFMATLNRDAAELMVEMGAHACTDITGFGLAGHLVEMVRGSGVVAELDLSALPVFGAVKGCIEQEIFPGAIERNQEYSMAWVDVPDDGHDGNLPVLYDPQTSGGLLVVLPSAQGRAYVEEMHRRGHGCTSIIGRIVEKGPEVEEGKIKVTNTELKNFIGKTEVIELVSKKNNPSRDAAKATEPAPQGACCASPPGVGVRTDVKDSLPLFMDFMGQAGKEGLLDARTKKFLWLALSVGFRCEPCMKVHVKSALEMGITKEEIQEAAALGVAFGGSPALMMYQDILRKIGI